MTESLCTPHVNYHSWENTLADLHSTTKMGYRQTKSLNITSIAKYLTQNKADKTLHKDISKYNLGSIATESTML